MAENSLSTASKVLTEFWKDVSNVDKAALIEHIEGESKKRRKIRQEEADQRATERWDESNTLWQRSIKIGVTKDKKLPVHLVYWSETATYQYLLAHQGFFVPGGQERIDNISSNDYLSDEERRQLAKDRAQELELYCRLEKSEKASERLCPAEGQLLYHYEKVRAFAADLMSSYGLIKRQGLYDEGMLERIAKGKELFEKLAATDLGVHNIAATSLAARHLHKQVASFKKHKWIDLEQNDWILDVLLSKCHEKVYDPESQQIRMDLFAAPAFLQTRDLVAMDESAFQEVRKRLNWEPVLKTHLDISYLAHASAIAYCAFTEWVRHDKKEEMYPLKEIEDERSDDSDNNL